MQKVMVRNSPSYSDVGVARRIRTILSGVTTKYYYDGQRVLLETDDAGTTNRREALGEERVSQGQRKGML